MSSGDSGGWFYRSVCVCACRLLAHLAHCQWLAYSAPNSCKVPSSPPWTNSCRSCPLRCAQTLHCVRLHAYVYAFEGETRGCQERAKLYSCLSTWCKWKMCVLQCTEASTGCCAIEHRAVLPVFCWLIGFLYCRKNKTHAEWQRLSL